MKILCRGTPPDEVEYEGTCVTCKTRAIFKKSEAREMPYSSSTCLEVKCPVCRSGTIRSHFTKYVPPPDYPTYYG